MGQNLTGQSIASTYEDLVQISGSILTDGLGVDINNITITASNAVSSSYALTASYAANVPDTASYAISASHADNADSSISASYALVATSAATATSASFATNANTANSATTSTSASHAVNADSAISASFATTAGSAGSATTAISASHAVNADVAVSSSFSSTALSASYSTTATSASHALVADSAGAATTAISASHSLNADNAISASFATTSTSASYALTASFALNGGGTVDTGSLMVTGSVASNILTFTKGDGSTFNLTVDTGSGVTTDTGSLLVTASISNADITFTKGDASTFSITVNNVSNASTASIATSASHAVNADSAISASYAVTASYAENASTPDLQTVTSVGALTSASVTFTDGTVASSVINGNGTSFEFYSNDDTTPLVINYYDSFVTPIANISLNPATSVLDITANGGITLQNNTIISGSLEVTSGITGSLEGTASFATATTSASHAVNADLAISSSYALTASYAENAGVTVDTGSLLVTASISDATITFTKGDASTFPITVNNVSNASTASIATSASFATTASAVNTTPANDGTAYDLVFVANQSAGTQAIRTDDNGNITFNPSTGVLAVPTLSGSATNATSASHAVNADSAISSSYALTASFALNAGTTVDTGSLMVTGSVASNVLTFTKGDGSTFNLTVDTGSGGGATPDLQAVTSVGSTTSASVTFTDGTVASSVIAGTGVSFEFYSNDDTTPLEINYYDSFVTPIGGIRFNPSTSTLGIAANGGIILQNNTQVTGSLEVSGSITGDLIGTASFATSASYALTASFLEGGVPTPDLQAVTSVGALTSASVTFTDGVAASSVIAGTGVSFEFYSNDDTTPLVISYYDSMVTPIANISLDPATSTLGITANGGITLQNNTQVTGSLDVSGGITGSLLGTASYATSALSSSYALTASYVEGGGATPDLQTVTSVGALTSASITFTDGLVASSVIDGDGTAFEFYSNDDTTPLEINYYDSLVTPIGGIKFNPATSVLDIAANGGITLQNNTQIIGSLDISSGASGSFSGSFQGDGSGLTGVTATAFPFTGSAQITGSLNVTGSVNINGNIVQALTTNTINTMRIYGTADQDTVIGKNAGGTSGGGGENTSIGENAGAALTSGVGNTFIGINTGDGITNGSDNIAIGRISMSNTATGVVRNIGIGYKALNTAQTNDNIAIGFEAGQFLTAGSGNVIIGKNDGGGISGTNNNLLLADGVGNTKLLINTSNLATFAGAISASAIVGGIDVTGSLNGNVSSTSIVSNTASLNLSTGNFFNLTLVSGSNTFITATNITPGQTVNYKLTQPGSGYGTVSFDSMFKFPAGSNYTGSAAANAVDIISFVSFDSTNLYANAIENLI